MSEGINDREVRRIREQQAERHVAPDPQEMIRRQAHPSSGRTTIFRVNADDEIVACGEFHMERMNDDLIWFRIGDRSFNLAAVNGAIKWVPHDPDTWEVDDAPPPEETGGVTKPQPTTDDVARWVRRAFDAEDALHAERERAEQAERERDEAIQLLIEWHHGGPSRYWRAQVGGVIARRYALRGEDDHE